MTFGWTEDVYDFGEDDEDDEISDEYSMIVASLIENTKLKSSKLRRFSVRLLIDAN